MAISCEILLYPELLNNHQLISIIQERHLRVENIERMTRSELIDLFRNYCVPYGQRKYRDSGRGKLLNKSRQYSPEPTAKSITHNNQFNNISKVSRTICDRLKPPPDILSGHMKRIKLENLNLDVNSTKRKMSVDSDTSVTESPTPPKKDKKLITWP